MATIVTEVPAGKRVTYDYAEMFDGNLREYVQGFDFKTSPEGFRITVLGYARRHGLKVRTTIRGRRLYIQAIREED